MWLMASLLDSTDLNLKLHLLQNKSVSDVSTHIIESYRNLHEEIRVKKGEDLLICQILCTSLQQNAPSQANVLFLDSWLQAADLWLFIVPPLHSCSLWKEQGLCQDAGMHLRFLQTLSVALISESSTKSTQCRISAALISPHSTEFCSPTK